MIFLIFRIVTFLVLAFLIFSFVGHSTSGISGEESPVSPMSRMSGRLSLTPPSRPLIRLVSENIDWLKNAAEISHDPKRLGESDTPEIRPFNRYFIPIAYAASSVIQGVYVPVLWAETETAGLIGMVLAFAYLTIGFALPLWSRRVARSGQLQCILIHREKYKGKVGSPGRNFAVMAERLIPCVVLLGLIEPTLVVVKFVAPRTQLEDAFDGTSPTSLFALACTYIGLLGMLIFGAGGLDELALDASMVAVKGFIGEAQGACAEGEERMQPDLGSVPSWPPEDAGTVQFGRLANHYDFLCKALTDVWRLNCAGGLWVSRVLLLFMGSLVLLAYSVGAHSCMPNVYRVAGVVLAVAGVTLLMRIANLSSLCTDSTPGQEAVVAAIHAYVGTSWKLPADQQHAYQTLLVHVSATPLGIKVCSIHITYDLVFKIAIPVVVQIPLIVSVFHKTEN